MDRFKPMLSSPLFHGLLSILTVAEASRRAYFIGNHGADRIDGPEPRSRANVVIRVGISGREAHPFGGYCVPRSTKFPPAITRFPKKLPQSYPAFNRVEVAQKLRVQPAVLPGHLSSFTHVPFLPA
jgi:hypothetical protein